MEDETETKAFFELKKRMEEEMDSDLYEDDNIFYRFLRARDLKVNHAEAMLREHLNWREEYDVKNIFKFQPPEVLKLYLPMNLLGHTKEGHVLRYVPTGNIDLRGILESCTEKEIVKHQIKIYEEDSAALKKQSKKMGRLVDKVVYIHDVKGLTFAKATDRKVILPLLQYSKMYLDNNPETLNCIYVLNASRIFEIIFSVIKTILPSKIVNKIKVYTDDSFKNDLLEIADAEILPAFLGGKKTDPDGNPLCNSFINHGGIIPEKYYRKNKQTFASLPDVRKETIPRAEIHKLRLEVNESGSNLEWEFQLKTGDIKFGILFEKENGENFEVVPTRWITASECSVTGIHECKDVGLYIFAFDNSHSDLSKDVFYRTQVNSS